MKMLKSFRDEKSLAVCQAPSVIQHDVEPDLAIQFIHHACCQMSPRSCSVLSQCEVQFNTPTLRRQDSFVIFDKRKRATLSRPQEQNSE